MKIIATVVRVEGACLSNIRAVQSAKAKLHEGYIYILKVVGMIHV
jgi:hypothetical protein